MKMKYVNVFLDYLAFNEMISNKHITMEDFWIKIFKLEQLNDGHKKQTFNLIVISNKDKLKKLLFFAFTCNFEKRCIIKKRSKLSKNINMPNS